MQQTNQPIPDQVPRITEITQEIERIRLEMAKESSGSNVSYSRMQELNAEMIGLYRRITDDSLPR